MINNRDKEKEDRQFQVKFLPRNRIVSIPEGTSILEAARLADIPLMADCGGVGLCGKCLVRLTSGKIHGGDSLPLSAQELGQNFIPACTSYPMGDVSVTVPEKSLALGVHWGLKGAGCVPMKETPWKLSPLVTKYYVEMEPPSVGDNMNDLDRLSLALRKKTGIGDFTINFKALWKLPEILRRARWQVSVAVDHSCSPPSIMTVEMYDTTQENYGIVIDIGTTTIEGALVDISTGEIRYYTSGANPQGKYGTDIISRLKFASRDNGLLVLNDIIMDKMNEILMELIIEGDISRDQVYSIVLSGNTVMIHFLLGLDTDPILKHPQTPGALVFPTYRAGELNLYAHPDAPVYITPGVGTYVGGDLISSLIYTGMPDGNFILTDIGTNGEVALVSDGLVICAATSAGPAFEGGGVKWGMPAVSGAINRVYFSRTHNDFSIVTIDNLPPRGICGTGLIDVMATLFRTGFIDRKGKFRGRRKTSRIRASGGMEEFVLAFSPGEEEVISITEQDIDYIIKSKGALYAGFSFLMKRFGREEKSIDGFYIAGALGGLLDVENGITIGLFPDIDRDRFHFLGNGSLHGGRILLLSGEARNKALDIARSAAYFDLSNESEYMNSYTSALFLPHTDLNRFPSVTMELQTARR